MSSDGRDARPVAGPARPCPACGAPAPEPYCSRCGQDQELPPLSLGAWLRDAADEVFSLDGRLPRTLALLLTRPGRLTALWVAGRRRDTVSPLRLYLLALLVFFATMFFLGLPGDAGSIGEALSRRGGAMRLAAEGEFRRVLTEVAVLVVPLLTLLLKGLYPRSGRYFIEHLVLALHALSFALLVGAVGWVLATALPSLADAIASACVVAALTYLMLALRTAYGSGLLASTLRVAVVAAVLSVAAFGLAYVAGNRFGGRIASLDGEAMESAEADYVAWKAAPPGEGRATALRAFAAYQGLVDSRRLSDHHRYHLGELQLALGLPSEALATAGTMLRRSPRDVLGLLLAARAHAALADSSAAAERYRAILALPAGELERQRRGYESHHAAPFPPAAAEAEAGLREGEAHAAVP